MGIKETFAELFARLECAPNFDGNPENALSVALVLTEGKVRYNLAMMPALIGLHGAYYIVLFRPGEYTGYSFHAPILRLSLPVLQVWIIMLGRCTTCTWTTSIMQANSMRMSTGRVNFRRAHCGLRVVG